MNLWRMQRFTWACYPASHPNFAWFFILINFLYFILLFTSTPAVAFSDNEYSWLPLASGVFSHWIMSERKQEWRVKRQYVYIESWGRNIRFISWKHSCSFPFLKKKSFFFFFKYLLLYKNCSQKVINNEDV